MSNSAVSHSPSVASRRSAARPPIVSYAGAIHLLRAVASFETLFVLFVFSGRYKAMPELAWFPVDITAFFFVASGAAALLARSWRINLGSALRDPGFIIFVLFMLWTCVSLLWSSFAEFNKIKSLHTVTLLAWSFVGAYLLVSSDWKQTKNVLVGTLILSVFLICYWAYYRFVLGLLEEQDGGAYKVNTYLAYAYHAQYLVAAVIALAISSRRSVSLILSLVCLVFIWGVMLLIGGRGPLIFSILMVPLALWILLVNRRSRRYRLRFLSLPVALLGVLGLLVVVSAETGYIDQLSKEATTLERLQTYKQAEFGDSMAGRIHAQEFAIDRWFEAPIFGWGVGEFHILYGVFRYPHNLFIEILMEEGIIGFALLVGLAVVGVVRAWKLWPEDQANWVAMAIVLLFLVELASRATVQGFLPDERPLFLFFGLVLGLGRRFISRGSRA